jgi:hypothetical protein
MTKLSYKIGDFASSVVVLADGRAMEVRRGKKTRFNTGERTFWPSVDAWKASLPEGCIPAALTESGKPTVSPWSSTNPVLTRIIERVRATDARHFWRPYTCVPRGTWEDEMKESIQFYKDAIVRYPHSADLYKNELAKSEAKLAELIASGKGAERLYAYKMNSHLFTLLPSGDMVKVYYSTRVNVVIIRGPVEDGHFTWTPLTNAEAPLWFRIEHDHMIRI